MAPLVALAPCAIVSDVAHRFRIGGRIQGVGFRPFVYRLAQALQLCGWVCNDGGEVEIHAQGPADQLETFAVALRTKAPPAALVRHIAVLSVTPEALDDFRIRDSTRGAESHIHLPTDLFACADCIAELCDPAARRHRYPFINCTQCGPRYTLIRALPYDRANTTLDRFALCAACSAEYLDPADRRFHAEPLACAACGPALYWREDGRETYGNETALAAALASLRSGGIIAVRGVGGYHLLCDAALESSVERLRQRKGRPAKPLAIVVPWLGATGLDYAQQVADLSAAEASALSDATRPIVLCRRRPHAALAANLAPGLDQVAVMLPYSPLLHLLLDGFGDSLVATSANISGEPVLTEPAHVEERLGHVADGFLHHDRPIARPADDSVVQVVAGVARPVRLGRGMSPLELSLADEIEVPTLGVGAFQKNTVTLAWGRRAVVSPHIGQLGSVRGQTVFAQVARELQALYGVQAQCIAHDAHPGFPNTRWAREAGLPLRAVWHHHAHAAALAGEFPEPSPCLCFTWDGIGLGPDKTLWGGEALLGRPGAWTRVASFRTFRLPGGDAASHQPWRSALGLCWESGRTWASGFNLATPLLRRAFDGGINAPVTSSVGRLFDAAAALVGTALNTSYEAEAAMRLEALCSNVTQASDVVELPLIRDAEGVWRSDWAPLLTALLDHRLSAGERAALFHESLARTLFHQALVARQEFGVNRIGLAGGVFQNRLLTERARFLLAAAGFEVLIPRLLPVNDAAISFGQIIEGSVLARRPRAPQASTKVANEPLGFV